MRSRGRPRHPDILTPREWEVLQLLREGLTNVAIAGRLGISNDGGKYHVSGILSKLGLNTREEAAVWKPEEHRRWWMPALPFLKWGTVAKIGGASLLAATAGGVAVLAWAAWRTDGGEEVTNDGLSGFPAPNPLAGREVYLAPDDQSLLIASPDTLDQSGLKVVHSFADLQASVNDATAAIIIDRAFAAQLDRD